MTRVDLGQYAPMLLPVALVAVLVLWKALARVSRRTRVVILGTLVLAALAVTNPLLLFLSLFLAIPLVIVFWLLRRGRRAVQTRRYAATAADQLVAQAAGEDAALVQHIRSTWDETMRRAGLGITDRQASLNLAAAQKASSSGDFFQRVSGLAAEWQADRADGRVVEGTTVVDVPRLVGIRAGRVGPEITLRPIATQTAADVLAVSDRLAAAWQVPTVEVIDLRTDGLIQLRILVRDPLHRVITPADLPPATHTSVPFGLSAMGNAVSLTLAERNLLSAGVPGSGKSGLQTALLVGVSHLPNVALLGIDLKRVELSPWRSRFSRIVKDRDAAGVLLAQVRAEVLRRYEVMEDRDLKKITPSAEFPLIVVVIDELAELLSGGMTRDEKQADAAAASTLRSIIQMGRAAGVVCWLATQKPSSETIPTAIRDLIQQRVAFRTTTDAMTDMVLGDGMHYDADASRIDTPGVAWAVIDGSSQPVRLRVAWHPDETVKALADASAASRVDLAWLDEGVSPDA